MVSVISPPDRVTLPAGPRPVRTVTPPESPWPAVLAQGADGAPCLLVSADAVPDSPSLLGDAGGHLAVPDDLVRSEDGHVLVMPMCVRRVSEFLQERDDASAPLSDGEAVTLAVSVARGTVAVLTSVAADECATGEWWLSDDGRPLLVLGEGADVRTAAQEMLTLTAEGCRTDAGGVRAAVTASAALVTRDAGLGHALDEAERLLFAVAAAEPLATAVLAPARARRVSVTRDDGLPPPDARPGRTWAALVPHVDSELGEILSRIGMAVWRRVRADRPKTDAVRSHRRPLLWAAGVVAAVVGVGLLWPQGSEAPAAAGTGEQASSGPYATPVTDPSRSPSARAHTSTSGDGRAADAARSAKAADAARSAKAADAAPALLSRWTGCADAACRGRLQEDPDAVWRGGAAGLPAAQRTLTMLDDFGDVAVLRAHGTSGVEPDQLVVIVHRDDSWLLRDIQNVAQQP